MFCIPIDADADATLKLHGEVLSLLPDDLQGMRDNIPSPLLIAITIPIPYAISISILATIVLCRHHCGKCDANHHRVCATSRELAPVLHHEIIIGDSVSGTTTSCRIELGKAF